ncbi:hypothetical protein B0H11DRAFT_2205301 [Mycena galericulata]|nr:hypothetical protein B0H11DRAFT_2205301 [Mycena galericulata]
MASIRRDVSIFGATGVQGAARVCSAVVESLLEDGTFIPRAMIHQEESRVGSLKERGVEVVKGDSGDKASLLSALRRSEAVKAQIQTWSLWRILWRNSRGILGRQSKVWMPESGDIFLKNMENLAIISTGKIQLHRIRINEINEIRRVQQIQLHRGYDVGTTTVATRCDDIRRSFFQEIQVSEANLKAFTKLLKLPIIAIYGGTPTSTSPSSMMISFEGWEVNKRIDYHSFRFFFSSRSTGSGAKEQNGSGISGMFNFFGKLPIEADPGELYFYWSGTSTSFILFVPEARRAGRLPNERRPPSRCRESEARVQGSARKGREIRGGRCAFGARAGLLDSNRWLLGFLVRKSPLSSDSTSKSTAQEYIPLIRSVVSDLLASGLLRSILTMESRQSDEFKALIAHISGGKGGEGGEGGVQGGGGGAGAGPTVNYDIKAVENLTTNISLWIKEISGTGKSVLGSPVLEEIPVACPAEPAPSLHRSLTSLTETKSQEVGSYKTMESTATLYRDGRLSVDVWTECNNPMHGLRGRVLVIVYDEHHNAIARSQEIRCDTRGGVLDPFTPSSGRQSFVQQFPQEIGQQAAGLGILQADETIFGGDADRILKLVGVVKAVVQML